MGVGVHACECMWVSVSVGEWVCAFWYMDSLNHSYYILQLLVKMAVYTSLKAHTATHVQQLSRKSDNTRVGARGQE